MAVDSTCTECGSGKLPDLVIPDFSRPLASIFFIAYLMRLPSRVLSTGVAYALNEYTDLIKY